MSSSQQTVHAVNGFAYGCIGADIHVFGDGVPLYILERWHPPARPDSAWLLDLPSRMLRSRFEVVDFTGRESELKDLRLWRDHGPRLAVQWLYAPGGQGKSRLAAQFAKESAAAGWTVATAARGPGVAHPPPGSQDLSVTDKGALLVVDYADRWPMAHLTWLLSNTFLHRVTDQARVLLLARNRDPWPALRASIADFQPDVSARALPPLADADDRRVGRGERHDMFVAARDAFADLYGVPADVIQPPDELSGPDFGLTLAVHMAALVAVDHHAKSGSAAEARDMAGLTSYLLDRERRHWQTLHEAGALGTTTREISHAAFIASLTGSLPYQEARVVLDQAGLGADADRLLADHAYCYPPGDPDTVLEPLYPDGLAEDFLALSLPGHDLPGHAADPWAGGIPELLLSTAGAGTSTDGEQDDGAVLPPYAPRTLTFLTAASYRWPHVLTTLEALDAHLPEDIEENSELAAAAADLAERLAPHQLAVTTSAPERARIHRELARRFDQSDRHEKRVSALAEAVRLYRELFAANPQDFTTDFVESSLQLGMALTFAELEASMELLLEQMGQFRGRIMPDRARLDQAAVAFQEAIDASRRLAEDNSSEHRARLATVLGVASFFGPRLGTSDRARAMALETVDIARRLASEISNEQTSKRSNDLAYALVMSAVTLVREYPERAWRMADEAVGIARRIAGDTPDEYPKHLVTVLCVQAAVLMMLERAEESIDTLTEAAELSSRGSPNDRDLGPWNHVMAQALGLVWLHEGATGTTSGIGVAVKVLNTLVHGDTTGRGPALLNMLFALEGMAETASRYDDVLSILRDIIHLLRTSNEIPYASDDELIGRSDLHSVFIASSVYLARRGQWEEALANVEEAASELQSEGSHTLEGCLTGALTIMTAYLADLDPDEEDDVHQQMANPHAVRVLERIAHTYRRLVRANAAHDRGLAVTMTILSEALWRLGRQQEAVEAGRESIRIRSRYVARDDDYEHRYQLGLALYRLSEKLTNTAQPEAAAAAAQEAATIWPPLSW